MSMSAAGARLRRPSPSSCPTSPSTAGARLRHPPPSSCPAFSTTVRARQHGLQLCHRAAHVVVRRPPPELPSAARSAVPATMDLICACCPPWISSASPTMGLCSASRRELNVVGPLLAMELVDGCRLREQSSFSFPSEGHPNSCWYCVIQTAVGIVFVLDST